MTSLAVSDLHLTDRPSDAYRWDLFPQLKDIIQKRAVEELFILGDLTEFKDYHSSVLVNRLVSALCGLLKDTGLETIHILKGNHDGLDPDTPYFGFLQQLPCCHFYAQPTKVGHRLFLPHTRDPDTDWSRVVFGDVAQVFFHGTVTGACSETGAKLSGISLDWFKRCKPGTLVLAGDIHQPQKVGPVQYVGAPYPVRYGDEFEPRAVLFGNGRTESVPLKAPRKVTLRVQASGEIDGPALKAGDFVRVVLSLREAELGQFHELRAAVSAAAKEAGATLQKVQLDRIVEDKPEGPLFRIKSVARSPEDELRAYCRARNVQGTLLELGLELLSSD